MGKIFKTAKLTTGFEAVILVILLSLAGYGLYKYAPGLVGMESKTMTAMKTSKKVIDNELSTDLLPTASSRLSSEVEDEPLIRLAGYAWNGQSALAAANGGPVTTKGSIMEQNGVNLEIVRQDWLSELGTMQLKFIEEYDNGNPYPSSDKAAAGIIIMGDGAPFYISTRQKKLNEIYGKGKYNLQVVGCVGGISNGEDKLIGPKAWKTNPQLMKGAVISVVPGDGDWVTALNHIFGNTLKVNPDFSTYDADAVNFFPSENDDYIKSAEELIKSQTGNFTVDLKEIVNGKLTGEIVTRKIVGCATWTPGDQMVFDALDGYTDIASTKDFPNQMATTLIMEKKWAMENPDLVSNLLKSALTAGNQMKQYDSWARYAGDCISKTFDLETGDYWYKKFKGQTGTKNGTTFNIGGTRALNYADVMQYYGLRDGKDRYKSVWNQVSTYLTELNPFGFNEAVDGIVPYSEAVNLFFLKNINDIDAGTVDEVDYSTNRTDVMASGEWHINFNTGSDVINSSSNRDLNTIFNLLVQAEQSKITLIGHTDATGSDAVNVPLSNTRAQSVANYLISRGIAPIRIQSVRGEGSSNPIDSNSTNVGRANNRRVNIILFN
jgi:OOP family OmpA-OmpF porin